MSWLRWPGSRRREELDRARQVLWTVRSALVESGWFTRGDFHDAPVEWIGAAARFLPQLCRETLAERDAHIARLQETVDRLRAKVPVTGDLARLTAERDRLLRAVYDLEEQTEYCRHHHPSGSGRRAPYDRHPTVDSRDFGAAYAAYAARLDAAVPGWQYDDLALMATGLAAGLAAAVTSSPRSEFPHDQR